MLKAPNYQAFFSVSLLYLKPTLILLKRDMAELLDVICMYLHFTLILLKREQQTHFFNIVCLFTFHFDSIKTKHLMLILEMLKLYLHFTLILLKLNCFSKFKIPLFKIYISL